MTAALERSFDRLERYTQRARQSAERGNLPEALANLAEAYFIANQLWHEVAKENLEKEASHHD